MHIHKKYFHDHLVLLLLTINAFLAVFGSVYILVRLGTSHGNTYITHYRPSLGINAFNYGSIWDMLSFVAFALLVLLVHTLLSLKAYRIRRQLAIMILTLGILLLLLTLIVSNSLLVLR